MFFQSNPFLSPTHYNLQKGGGAMQEEQHFDLPGTGRKNF